MLKVRFLHIRAVFILIQVRNGHIKRLTDPDIRSSVLEIMGTNVSTTFITTPPESDQVLGIKLPFLVMILKNVYCMHPCDPHPLVEEVFLLRGASAGRQGGS